VRDKILKILEDNAHFDGTLPVARMIGRYISDNLDKGTGELTPDYIKTLVFPDRQKIKEKNLARKFDEDLKRFSDFAEKARVDSIHKHHSDFLSGILERQKESKASADRIAEKTDHLGEKLSARQNELVERLAGEYCKLMGDQKTEMGDYFSTVLAKIDQKDHFGNHFEEVGGWFSKVGEHIEKVKSDIQSEIKQATKIPPPPETEELYIEETGQVIEVTR